jgi:hypothetical protein
MAAGSSNWKHGLELTGEEERIADCGDGHGIVKSPCHPAGEFRSLVDRRFLSDII